LLEEKQMARVKHVARVVQNVAQSSRQMRWTEIRKSTAGSVHTVFGLTIGLAWSQVVTLGFAAAGFPSTSALVTAKQIDY
jgi:hypothetical protein